MKVLDSNTSEGNKRRLLRNNEPKRPRNEDTSEEARGESAVNQTL